MPSAPNDTPRVPVPPGMVAYELDVAGEQIVLFVWQSEESSQPLASGEREVLQLVLEGHSNAEIGAARGTSARTVANQVASLLRKLGARSRFELIGRSGRDRGSAPPAPPPASAKKKAVRSRPSR